MSRESKDILEDDGIDLALAGLESLSRVSSEVSVEAVREALPNTSNSTEQEEKEEGGHSEGESEGEKGTTRENGREGKGEKRKVKESKAEKGGESAQKQAKRKKVEAKRVLLKLVGYKEGEKIVTQYVREHGQKQLLKGDGIHLVHQFVLNVMFRYFKNKLIPARGSAQHKRVSLSAMVEYIFETLRSLGPSEGTVVLMFQETPRWKEWIELVARLIPSFVEIEGGGKLGFLSFDLHSASRQSIVTKQEKAAYDYLYGAKPGQEGPE